MASEKDRWWCKRCQAFVTDRPASKHPNGHILVSVPGSALDAHTAEVVEQCTQLLIAKAQSYDMRGRHDDGTILLMAVDAIRALAPRKEG